MLGRAFGERSRVEKLKGMPLGTGGRVGSVGILVRCVGRVVTVLEFR